MDNLVSNWLKKLTKKGVEIRRKDDIDEDIYWRPLKNVKQLTPENENWVLTVLKENNFDEKLNRARDSEKDYITLYYNPLELPRNVMLLETEFINYLSNTVDDFKGVVGVTDINRYKSEKSRIDVIIKNNRSDLDE